MARPNVAERNGYTREPFETAGSVTTSTAAARARRCCCSTRCRRSAGGRSGFANHIRDNGYRVVMPILVGGIREGPVGGLRGGLTLAPEFTVNVVKICVSREFVALLQHRSSPVTRYLLALARAEAIASGRPTVGVIGMCFSGGFALATAIDPVVGRGGREPARAAVRCGTARLDPGPGRRPRSDRGRPADARRAPRRSGPLHPRAALRRRPDRPEGARRADRAGARARSEAHPDPGRPAIRCCRMPRTARRTRAVRRQLDEALADVIATLDERLKN